MPNARGRVGSTYAITGARVSSPTMSIHEYRRCHGGASARCDPATAINVISEAWSTPLDPRITPDARAARNFTNSVAIINACQPYHWKDQYAKTCYFPEETRRQAAEKWKDVLKLD